MKRYSTKRHYWSRQICGHWMRFIWQPPFLCSNTSRRLWSTIGGWPRLQSGRACGSCRQADGRRGDRPLQKGTYAKTAGTGTGRFKRTPTQRRPEQGPAASKGHLRKDGRRRDRPLQKGTYAKTAGAGDRPLQKGTYAETAGTNTGRFKRAPTQRRPARTLAASKGHLRKDGRCGGRPLQLDARSSMDRIECVILP